MVAGDFNNTASTNGLEVRLNVNGLGTQWSSIVSYPSTLRPQDLAAGDLNGSGHLDIVKGGQGGISAFVNDGDGNLTWTVIHGGNYEVTGLRLVDIDGDGDLDIVASINWPAGEIRTYLNQGGAQAGTMGTFPNTPSFVLPMPAVSSIRGIAVGDFNGDGIPDAAVVSATNDDKTLRIYSGDGTGAFTLEETIEFPDLLQSVTAADVNGNGHLDLIIGGFNATGFLIYGNGDYTFGNLKTWTNTDFPLNGRVRGYFYDVDNNGRMDVVFSSSNNGRVHVLRNEGNETWVNGQPAEYVMGNPDFTTGATGPTDSLFGSVHSVAIDRNFGKIYVGDTFNHRVLRFDYPITSSTPSADLVFGQTDMTANAGNSGGLSGSSLNLPHGLEVDNLGTLYISDHVNNRVLIFHNAHSLATNKPTADRVLGQATMGTSTASTTATGLNGPTGLMIDRHGNLWVADRTNNRVLRYDNIAEKASGAAADAVLGQATFTTAAVGLNQSGLANPGYMAILGNSLFVSDGGNRRFLRYDDVYNLANGAPANVVLGQPDFTSNAIWTPSANRISNSAAGIAVDPAGRLYAADNNRILIFENATTLESDASAVGVLGQDTLGTNVQNHTQAGLGAITDIALDPLGRTLAVGQFGVSGRVSLFKAGTRLYNEPEAVLFDSGQSTPLPGPFPATRLQFGDITNDGTIDILIDQAVSSVAGFGIYSNNGTGNFTNIFSRARPAGNANLVDLNGDGLLDIVAAGGGTAFPSTMQVHLATSSDGTGWAPVVEYETQNRPDAVVVGDMNGNGFIDVIVGTLHVNNQGTFRVFENDGAGNFTPGSQVVAGEVRSLNVLDLDGDGDLDVVVLTWGGELRIHHNQGGKQGGTEGTFLATPDHVYSTTTVHTNSKVADLNGNGFMSLIQATGTQTVRIWDPIPETGGMVIANEITLPFNGFNFDVADVNGNGFPDLLVGAYGGHSRIYWGRGDGTFVPGPQFVAPPAELNIFDRVALHAADVNGNGFLDIVLGDWSRSRFIVYRQVPPTVPDVTIDDLPEFTNQTNHPGIALSFTENVTGLELTDFTTNGITISNLQGSGASYTVDVTLTGGDGEKSFFLPANSVTGAAGLGNTESNTVSATFDTTAPTVTIAALPSPTNQAEHPTIAITFSESVTGLALGNFSTNGVSLSNLQGSGTSYTVDVILTGADGEKSFSLNASAATDAAGNTSTASNTVTTIFDTTAPTVTIAALPNPTNQAEHPGITITFSESVTGLALSDFSTNGVSLANLQGSGTSYTVDVTLTGADGEKTLSVNASAATDAAGNASTASNTVTTIFDTSAPTVTIAALPSPTNQAEHPGIAITFSESVTGLVLGDFSTDGVSLANLQGSGTSYTVDVTLTGADGEKSFSLNASAATDVAGNTSAASNTVTTIFDTTAPTVTIAALPNPTNQAEHPGIAITFSESVTGLALGDFSTNGVSLSNLQGSGTSYTVDVTLTGADGEKSFSLNASAATDAAGNTSTDFQHRHHNL
jgi:hypothetical protein